MKKIIITLTLLSVISCKKDKDCHCGESMTESLDEIMEQEGDCPQIEVKNICSGNINTFCLGQEDGVYASYNHYPEDYYCSSNGETW